MLRLQKIQPERASRIHACRPHNLPGIWSLEPKLRLIFHNTMNKLRVFPCRASGHWNPRASPSHQSMNLTSLPSHSHNVCVIIPREQHDNSPRCPTGQTAEKSTRERKGQQDPRRPHNLPGIWSLEPKLRLIFHNSMKKLRVVPRRASGHWNARASPSHQSMNLTSHPSHCDIIATM